MNIYDIAREAGVSIATVSRVLNDSPKVSNKTREKIEVILKANNYSPSAIARGMVTNSIKTIGVLVVDIRDLYYANVAFSIEQELSSYGYNVILCNTGGNTERKEHYMRVLTEKKVDGLILVGSVFKDARLDEQINIVSKKIPIILANGLNEAENVYSILCDDVKGAEICVDYLFSKGRRNIIYFQDAETYSAKCKVDGFKNGLIKNNLINDNPINATVINSKYGSNDAFPVIKIEKGIETATDSIISLINSGINFDAVITGDDLTAVGVLKGLNICNKKVPKEISVIGFNDSILSKCCTPELTTVANGMDKIGISAANLLKDVLDGKKPDKKTMLYPKLIVRASA